MMKKLSKRLAMLLAVTMFAGLMAGCNGGTDAEATPAPTQGLEQPADPTATTAPTETPVPTEEPKATATPFPTQAPITVEKRNVDVWDFGGVQETDALYKNNITAADWDAYADLAEGGTFSNDGTVSFGDLTLNYKAKDRLFSGTSVKNYGSNGLAQTAHEDGYTADGMYYCNGTGGDNRRYMTLANVKAGDKILVYMGAHNAADDVLYFQYMGEGGTQLEEHAYGQKIFSRHVFVAQYSGTYKIWTGTGAKPGYNRVVRIPGVTVTGYIDNAGFDIAGTTLKFVNNTTNAVTEVDTANGSFAAVLAPGFEYTAVLSGLNGVGFTNDSKFVTVADADVANGQISTTLVVEAKSIYAYTGKITGFAADYDASKLAVKLMAPADSTYNDVDLTINADLTFTASLEPDVEYTLVLSGVNDYEIVSSVTIQDNQAKNENIQVATKAVYDITGGFLGCEAKDVTAIKFANEEDAYEYAGTLSADGYSVALRDGA
ncbi:MAG: hypothetical protein J6K15_07510, partial [Lachnospiraceae bacterium]|nr:hypothetical protein [Lachnospiraceae bacterium]